MTGSDDYLPLMADSERALGRLDRALALIREADTSTLDRATQIELRIVESGIRRDQGLADAAVIALQVPELTGGRLRPWSARLFYAYADALLAAGRTEEARDAFARAAAADPDGETDAADRLDELDGVEFEDLADESEDSEGDSGGDSEEVTADPVLARGTARSRCPAPARSAVTAGRSSPARPGWPRTPARTPRLARGPSDRRPAAGRRPRARAPRIRSPRGPRR
jgi:hypothetical protein